MGELLERALRKALAAGYAGITVACEPTGHRWIMIAQLHCYLPEQAGQCWARLRHQGARRSRLIESAIACGQQLRDLLEVAWPTVLTAAARTAVRRQRSGDIRAWAGAHGVAVSRTTSRPTCRPLVASAADALFPGLSAMAVVGRLRE